ncbi:MAG TPA: antibiotic biosynthesis monooxygenase [Bacteroidota bacterium]|nr:antibiotic biosynthesis monooxygenase [Bacteroidota bacterium]
MYMRLVQVRVKPEHLPELRRMYLEKVIPALRGVTGCLFANLIQSERHPEECISMTLWDDRGRAEVYEKVGKFKELLREVSPFLADSSEWKIQLSEDLTLQYEPVPEEPVVKSYEVTAAEDSRPPAQDRSSSMFVRIVSPQVREEKLDEFVQIYREEVLPALRKVEGCRYACLTENVQEKTQVISVTIWDSKHDADEYERGGLFDALKDKLEHTFAGVYQWKMQLEKDTGGHVVTSEEITVGGYKIVAGKGFF